MTVKGFEIPEYKLQGSASRRAQMYKNSIIATLKKIGVHEDDIKIDLISIAIQRRPAAVSFWFDDRHLYFSYTKSNFIGNIHVIAKVLEKYVEALINEERSMNDFINDFAEDKDVESKREEARELLGVGDTLDIDEINKKYKQLARDHHPDMGGDTKIFQEINNAHKLLKRELV
jgi:hypothetical protein